MDKTVFLIDDESLGALAAVNFIVHVELWTSTLFSPFLGKRGVALKVLQTNLNHSRAASASLGGTFTKGNFDLALIQEASISRDPIAELGEISGKIAYCNNVIEQL